MINIRNATLDDARELLDIYAPYIEKTAITFEYDVPTLDEFRERISLRIRVQGACGIPMECRDLDIP